ncbi:thymidine kinase, cytosolic isoform X3 [Rhineura floridana]|uniref:thymidine kinase, cytosolic isoform X3 n=1 Tax=Rhineura floridana TaxID=261503 RepID=UPI002AC8880F|nr:thymidine kinase, cytosolic isoform X3 [Rhineura floridana]
MNCLMMPGVQPGSPIKARGQIQVIFGPMFSGKSTELMRRVRRFQIAQYKCLLINYAKDTRYCVNGVSTHDRNTMEALSACCLKDVHQEALGSAVIGIDEGQFAFGNILQLVPLAESVVKLNAVCMECYREASYTKRLGAEKEVEVIGGADKYHSVCRVCYFKKRQQQPATDNKENLPGGNKQLDITASRKALAARQIMHWSPSH